MIIRKLNEQKLKEETIANSLEKDVQDAKKELDAKVYSGDGIIESALNRSLKVAKRTQLHNGSDYPNILFVGEAGTGKTSRIRAWAEKNNINLYEVRAAGMDDTDLGGAIVPMEGVVQRLASTEFDVLNEPNSVLFLDEYNRAPKSVRTNLLELVNSHVVPDPRVKGGQRKLENFLFTVAAINPPSADYDTDEMDSAEVSRFRRVAVPAEKQATIGYYNSEIDKLLNGTDVDDEYKLELERKKHLINVLIPNKLFKFDDALSIAKMKANHINEIVSPTNSRTLLALLKACDGTKDDFLDLWDDYCNPDQKGTIETILKEYEDVQDKATDVLTQHETESEILKKPENALDRLNKYKNKK